MNIPQKLKNKIYFIIPNYNEKFEIVEECLKQFEKEKFKNIILIDDGSHKDIEKIEKVFSKKITILKHIINRGAGAAQQTGVDYCLKQKDCKYVITFDSDGQHNLQDLEKFIKILENDKEKQVVLGSRFLLKEHKKLVPFKKRVLLWGSLILTKFLSNIKVSDTHNGYMAFRKKILKDINISLDRFEHKSEILDKISKNKIKFSEVPTLIKYTDYTKNKGQRIINSINILFKLVLK